MNCVLGSQQVAHVEKTGNSLTETDRNELDVTPELNTVTNVVVVESRQTIRSIHGQFV